MTEDDDDKMTGTLPIKVITSFIRTCTKKTRESDGYVAKRLAKTPTTIRPTKKPTETKKKTI